MLSIGPCRLRFLVIGQEPSCPLLFLTLHGINEVVTVDPESGEGQKKFFFLPIEGEKDWYIIASEPPSAINTPGLARKGDDVILSEKPDKWRFQRIPINMENGDVYEIHHEEAIGVLELLGKHKDNDKATVESFVVDYVGPKPAWQPWFE